jgi:bla regulator protein blaR1
MKSVNDLFSAWPEALGWTLLNSIWQGLLVLLLVIAALRFIPSQFSRTRYAVSCGSLLLFVLANVATFTMLIQENNVTSSFTVAFSNSGAKLLSNLTSTSGETVWQTIRSAIDSSMNWILIGWSIGALLFSLRMVSGWWYISRLKAHAEIVENEWNDRLQQLAAQLHVKGIVQLAQSARIQTPVVLGVIKPVILVPIGMFSGLTTEQIETIFIHELAHIKRHDYLVNLIQSIVETIFFFNPFVWIVSSVIRREREYCCDDAVIQKNGSALVYARALTSLEDVRLSKTSFALSLAENKNQLLNRIKRLMEKSVKNYSGRERLVPAILLVIGLLCASWLTIKSENTFSSFDGNMLLQDTTKRKPKKGPSKSPDKVTSEKEKSKEDSWREEGPVTYTYQFKQPGQAPKVYDFTFRSRRDWEEFSKEFEEKFKNKFEDFYKNNSKDFDKLMEEMRENFEQGAYDKHFEELRALEVAHADEFAALAPAFEAIPEIEEIDVKELHELQALAEIDHTEAMKALEEIDMINDLHLDGLEKQMEEHAAQLEFHARDLEAAQMELQEMESRMEAFEREIMKELIKDGYLKEGEELKSINWDDRDSIEINGKKIKEVDEKKYHQIHRKYFKGNFRWVQ